jgi:hypothetical protein
VTEWEKQELLIAGMTYPTPHKECLDTVCTGGVTKDGNWIRLYPLSYRYLDKDQQYKMFSWLRLQVAKNEKDPRVESYRVDEGSIQVLGEEKDWAARRAALLPLLSPHLENLRERNQRNPRALSMGLVEVTYQDFYWKETDRAWSSKHLREMSQLQLVGPQRKPLEKMPYELRLKFRCKSNPACSGHDMNIFTWEYCQTFRRWRDDGRYGDELGVLAKMKEAIEEKRFSPKNDTYVLLGTVFKYPKVWVIGGIFAPPKRTASTPRLF